MTHFCPGPDLSVHSLVWSPGCGVRSPHLCSLESPGDKGNEFRGPKLEHFIRLIPRLIYAISAQISFLTHILLQQSHAWMPRLPGISSGEWKPTSKFQMIGSESRWPKAWSQSRGLWLETLNKTAAEACSREVQGVRGIVNKITVEPAALPLEA